MFSCRFVFYPFFLRKQRSETGAVFVCKYIAAQRGGDMPRARNPNRDKAFEIYKKHNGEIDLVEIASQLNISAGTVRGWKSKDKWDQKLNGTFQKNMERSKKETNAKKEAVDQDVRQVLNNTEINDKQRLFCLHYVRCFNATRAYQKAYECSYETAAAIGYRMLENVGVKAEIKRLKQNRLNREMLDESDIFQKYMDIAFADITDYVSFGTRKAVDGKTGEEYETSFVRLKDSREVDGTLISEVSKGKAGTKIKLADRMKALDWLAEHMDMANDEQKARIEQIKAKTEQIRGADQNPVEDKVQKLFKAIGGALDESE